MFYTGKNCPMQVGYDVKNCKCEGCSYRTAPMTNYDRIKQMSVDDLSDFLNVITNSLAIKVYGNYIVREKDIIKQWLESEVNDVR